MHVRVDKWLDLLDRAGWTALQAAAGAALAALTVGGLTWEAALISVGVATAAAVLKVVVGQRTGADDTGALIGKPVVEAEKA